MLCHGSLCNRRVSPGFRLCQECRQALRTGLCSLPGLFRECERRLAYLPCSSTQRVSGTGPKGIALNEAAMNARAKIADVLSSWCALVAAQKQVAGPGVVGVSDLAAFLERHLDWLAAHPAVGEFVAEIAQLVETGQAVIEPGRARPRALGPCDRTGCGHTVYLRYDDGAQVRCTAGHSWLPHEWLALSLHIRQASPHAERAV
ncbi:hypothetical protein Pth03_27880 [Planotetraspora thailandica]|uniref:Uncharacterized protein n=1 Tax=Planotetraspora thailandica TaxID=487172 RepID=A0A8J3UYH9_9ACTN|nr:hypothetical protein [Planotetraspora thailandica]GII54399.1 hypothetical protein Pth03_27880 [Planotetraspora thailandica]